MLTGGLLCPPVPVGGRPEALAIAGAVRMMMPAEAVGVFDRMWSDTDLTASEQYTPGPY